MTIQIGDWVMNKIFTEIRFPSSSKFFDQKNRLLQNMISDFPEYNVSNVDSLLLHTAENPGIDIKIFPNRFLLDYETNDDLDEFRQVCQENWSLIYKALDVKTVDRFGVRATLVREMSEKDANEIVKGFIDTKQIELGPALIGGEITFYLCEMDRKVKMAIKPGMFHSVVLTSQVQKTFSAKGLIADIDFSTEKSNSNSVVHLFQTSIETIQKYLSKLM